MRTRATAAAVAVFALLTWLAAPALAAAPLRLASEMAAINHVYAADQIELYVDYVPTFSGQNATSWVDHISLATTQLDQLNAIAVESAPAAGSGISGGAEAAIAAGGAVVLTGLAILLSRRKSRSRSGQSGRVGAGPPPGPPTEELEAQASRVLVETDDAVRTSDQELGFARARFGEQAVAPFAAALKSARLELAEGFRLSQLLDDDIPETESTRRQYLTRISSHCAEASRLLDEQSEAFDRLQDLQARAPKVLAEVDAHAVQQSARLEHSRQLLDQLAAKYTVRAVAAVAANPDQAAERLTFAGSGVSDARAVLAGQKTGEAAVFLQAAESAADQASDLLSAVEHLEAELTQAASALPAALREIDADIAEGTAMLAARPGDERAGLIGRAQQIAEQTRAQFGGGPFDTLTALRAVGQADAAVDHALASVREEQPRRERASALLDQAMLVARSSVQAAEDFIATRRGGVEAQARTRLAEAQRHFQQAMSSARQDPQASLTEAEYADALAQQARSLAEQDVGRFEDDQAGPVRGGGFGAGLGGAVLGGIMIDSMLGPGSFGGMGTRRRRSISR